MRNKIKQKYLHSLHCLLDEKNPSDSSELSFSEGDILEIADYRGKWWQAKKSDNEVGIVPSNYVSLHFFLKIYF